MSAGAAVQSANLVRAESDFSTLTILLLTGVLYRGAGKRLWCSLLELQDRVRDYVAVVGLELVLEEGEGYALLRPRADALAEGLPPLLPSHLLALPTALLLARLRMALADFDVHGDATRLVLTQAQLDALLQPFLVSARDDASLRLQTQAHVDRLIELGALCRLASHGGPAAYEVQRVLRAVVDSSWLNALERCVRAARTAPVGTGQT